MSQKEDMTQSLKALEVDALQLFEQLGHNAAVDRRALSLAQTNLQQSILWAIKAVEEVKS